METSKSSGIGVLNIYLEKTSMATEIMRRKKIKLGR
jgi:hypothetical protein